MEILGKIHIFAFAVRACESELCLSHIASLPQFATECIGLEILVRLPRRARKRERRD